MSREVLQTIADIYHALITTIKGQFLPYNLYIFPVLNVGNRLSPTYTRLRNTAGNMTDFERREKTEWLHVSDNVDELKLR